MEKRVLRPIGILIGIGIFFAALWSIHHALGGQNYRDIIQSLRQVPPHRIFLALGLTTLNYILLAAFDLLAARYAGRPLPYRTIALSSFIGYTFHYNAGAFGGSAVRYRLYSLLGFSAVEIGKVILLFFLTFLLGFLTLSGIALIVEPPRALLGMSAEPWFLKGMGVLFLGIIGFYLWCAWKQIPFSILRWNVTLPNFPTSLMQLTLASVDWVVAGAILYVLFPRGFGVPFPLFVSIFILAHIAGIASHAPGGIGVFEATMMNLLPTEIPASGILGVLLAYRGIYYLCPFLIASVLLSIQEYRHRREDIRKTTQLATRWLEAIAPTVLSIVTFLAGTIMLLSGSLPAATTRLHMLTRFVPLSVFELSHFLGSIIGISLLFLAWGLQQRLDGAYIITILLLLIGIPIALLRGFDYENAITLTIALLILLPCRKAFTRKTSLLSPQLTPEWFATIGVVLACAIWLGFFAIQHVEVSSQIWWKFALQEDAPRFLRASLGAVVLLLTLGLYELFRPREHSHYSLSTEEDRGAVRTIARSSPSPLAWLALLRDKYFLFSPSGRTFLMYGIVGKSWIVLGDPVGAEEEKEGLIWRFKELADQHQRWMVVTHLPPGSLPVYIDLGLTFVKIGEEARIRLMGLPLSGNGSGTLREILEQGEANGYAFEVIPRESTLEVLPELKCISDAWLSRTHAQERHFSVGRFDPSFLQEFPIAILRRKGRIHAFSNLLLGARNQALAPDLVRFNSGMPPPDPLELLLAHIILWGRAQGYEWCDLGLVPPLPLETDHGNTIGRAEGWTSFQHGECLESIQTIKQIEEKFHPLWEPRFLACPAGLSLPLTLRNHASLVSGRGDRMIAR